jgi:DNA-binding CsgD family transcriptional regulator
MLVSGHTLEQAADQLFISIHTARTHLKRILLKTDTGRQAELLRTMLLGAAQLALD